jgi:nitroimidazol reductase NimA-like FMN-containing flavoprotein (pyridoxamine 5'-phosphate oxidase superfamily)
MNRRDLIALTPDEQRKYLDEGHTMVLGTNGRRGHPQLTAMWYVNDPDGTIWMTTFAKSQKTKNVERDPHVTLLIESGRSSPRAEGHDDHGHRRHHPRRRARSSTCSSA